MKQTASLKLALAGAALAALPATAAVPEITDVTMSQSEASRWVKNHLRPLRGGGRHAGRLSRREVGDAEVLSLGGLPARRPPRQP